MEFQAQVNRYLQTYRGFPSPMCSVYLATVKWNQGHKHAKLRNLHSSEFFFFPIGEVIGNHMCNHSLNSIGKKPIILFLYVILCLSLWLPWKLIICESQDISLPRKTASCDTFIMWFKMGWTFQFRWLSLDGGGIEG